MGKDKGTGADDKVSENSNKFHMEMNNSKNLTVYNSIDRSSSKQSMEQSKVKLPTMKLISPSNMKTMAIHDELFTDRSAKPTPVKQKKVAIRNFILNKNLLKTGNDKSAP